MGIAVIWNEGCIKIVGRIKGRRPGSDMSGGIGPMSDPPLRGLIRPTSLIRPTCLIRPTVVLLLSLGVAGISVAQTCRVPGDGLLTPQMIACARAEKEAEVAIAKPGVKVCRRLTVGIGVEDWIQGVVIDAGAGRVGVRIDDPGRIQQSWNGKPLVRGEVVWDAVTAWTPCF